MARREHRHRAPRWRLDAAGLMPGHDTVEDADALSLNEPLRRDLISGDSRGPDSDARVLSPGYQPVAGAEDHQVANDHGNRHGKPALGLGPPLVCALDR